MKRTSSVTEKAKKIVEDREHPLVIEATRRAIALDAAPPFPGYRASILTELCFLIWQQSGMPLHKNETIE